MGIRAQMRPQNESPMNERWDVLSRRDGEEELPSRQPALQPVELSNQIKKLSHGQHLSTHPQSGSGQR